MENLFIVLMLTCLALLYIENKHPTFKKQVLKKTKDALKIFWKNLKAWESGN